MRSATARVAFLPTAEDGRATPPDLGSGGYWPNGIFYARPIPDHPTKVVGVVTGHHVGRVGELYIFDPARGRYTIDGVVQRIPGFGKTLEPVILDGQIGGSWPLFLHPYPLSDKYFLAVTGSSVYLLDVFDNMLCLKKRDNGGGYYEPIPLRKTKRPAIMPDRINLDSKEATVLINDVYEGPGLEGVPRGTVKRLRLYALHYAYPGMGGHIHVGIDGPWDVRVILGTVKHPNGNMGDGSGGRSIGPSAHNDRGGKPVRLGHDGKNATEHALMEPPAQAAS
mgnify:CR=1 FL=1